ncbi:CsbD family protein [Streptomyces corynorhini]|uniref:CsbD family protein n=1 Tax=Streptomyces corynorhini TaxID=2282652 RepID=A0A370BAA3_9ACTN|nr:CsbD family protein [Streptomyces corynorhini]RDG37319.1 CsbD family protein [Streptomyces corynorhini]
MAADEKAQAKGEQAKGKVKKVVGGALGNESMETEGHAEETKGDLRGAKEKVKDAFKSK